MMRNQDRFQSFVLAQLSAVDAAERDDLLVAGDADVAVGLVVGDPGFEVEPAGER
jgi:hypothetical protein